jgi:hypothetical protein
LIGQDREIEIKRKIINILKPFRSPGILGDSDVKINSLEKENDYFKIAGEYQYKNLFDKFSFEDGTFDISLSESNLQPTNVRITPNKKAFKMS